METITIPKETLQVLLTALDSYIDSDDKWPTSEALLKAFYDARKAEQESALQRVADLGQEIEAAPVAWLCKTHERCEVVMYECDVFGQATPLYVHQDRKPFERIAECAARLVEHADFQLGGILSADSKAKDIPNKAVSQVKSRHLAALRDSLAAHRIKAKP